MATSFAVDLVFKSQTQQLDAVVNKITKLERDLGKLKGADPFQGVEDSARGAGNATEKAGRQAKAATGAFKGLGAAIGGLVSAAALMQGAKFIFGKTAELETQTRSIQVLTGSLVKAKDIVGQLQQYANVTPFTSSEIIDAAKRLTAFGVSANRVVDTTKRLGDVAGATGANLGELSLAYGQVMAKGRLQGEELLQFQERGVALQDELKKMYGLTGEEFADALSKGRISAEAVEVALQRLTSAGGKYAEGAISQSDTLNGRLSTLQDAIDGVARAVGKVLTPAVLGALKTANERLAEMPAFVENIGLAFKYAADKLAPFINGLSQMHWYFKNLTPPGWAMQVIGGSAGLAGSAINEGARRQREQNGYVSRFAGARDEAFRRAQQIGSTAATSLAPPPLLGGESSGTGGGGSKSKADKKLVTLTGLAMGAGFSPADARIMAAIALAESGGNPMAHNPNASTGDNSYGLWQINMLGGMGPERRRSLGLSSNEQLFDPATNARAARQVHGSQGFGAWSVYRSGAYKQFLGKDATVSGGDTADIASAWLDAQKAIEDSYATGVRLTSEFDRQVKLMQAGSDSARKLLQIEHEYEDRKAQINELVDEGQKKGLEELNNKIRSLEITKEEVAALYEKLGVQDLLNKSYKEGAGAFRTDIDLDPNKKQGKLQGYMDNLRAELADTEGMITSLAGTIESEIGSAMSNAIMGVIQGTMTVEQAMSQMFSNIGAAFIEMATQMIAKALILKVLGLLNPGGGGGLFSGAGPYQFPSGGGFNGFVPTLPKLYAEGGFVTGPTRALIGEGGESEYVIPAGKMGEAMNRYAAGRRGSSVIPDSSSGGGGAGGGGGHYTLETVVINNIEYATVEQVRAMGRQSAQQGAAGGHSRVMGDLRNRRSTRSRLGLA